MKTIGIIGGMSWESTVEYYRNLNLEIRKRLGGHHSAKILLYSVDFAEIEKLQRQNQWEESAQILSEAAKNLELGGADCILLATNTMHKVADQIENAIQIPFIHIADVVGNYIRKLNFTTIGLLGTRFTMEETFYRDRLKENFEIETLIPDSNDRNEIHRIIFDELCHGKLETTSKEIFLQVIDKLRITGAQLIVLGCTEIGLLIKEKDLPIPMIDSGFIHAQAAIEFALS